MIFLENKGEVEGQLRQLKLTMMQQDPIEMAPEMFPEFFAPPEIRMLDSLDDDVEIEIVNEATPEEVDEFLAFMGVSRR
jgi:hypothetical protein